MFFAKSGCFLFPSFLLNKQPVMGRRNTGALCNWYPCLLQSFPMPTQRFPERVFFSHFPKLKEKAIESSARRCVSVCARLSNPAQNSSFVLHHEQLTNYTCRIDFLCPDTYLICFFVILSESYQSSQGRHGGVVCWCSNFWFIGFFIVTELTLHFICAEIV